MERELAKGEIEKRAWDEADFLTVCFVDRQNDLGNLLEMQSHLPLETGSESETLQMGPGDVFS